MWDQPPQDWIILAGNQKSTICRVRQPKVWWGLEGRLLQPDQDGEPQGKAENHPTPQGKKSSVEKLNKETRKKPVDNPLLFRTQPSLEIPLQLQPHLKLSRYSFQVGCFIIGAIISFYLCLHMFCCRNDNSSAGHHTDSWTHYHQYTVLDQQCRKLIFRTSWSIWSQQ